MTAAVLSVLAVGQSARAQYPQVPAELKAAGEARQAEAAKQSKANWEKAQVQMKADEANGRFFYPWVGQPGELPQATIPAFPGAEGGGMYSHGGRGGKVYVVTSLEDSGPGTFREACEAGGARIVVFNVAGIINLKSRISIRAPYITIAGQTAPGDGVCIAGNTVELDTHDVIIRHMRFRRGATDVTERNDSIGGNPVGNIMIDHVSASWGLDENMSMYRHMYSPPDGTKDLKLATVNITIQNSIFSECLNTYNHAFGSTIGGYNSTFHRNLWANNSGRNPSIGMNGDFGMFNNVVFNWVHRTTDGGDHLSYYNIINNYWKPGPATPNSDVRHRLLKPEARRGKDAPKDFGKAYVNGNIVEGNEKVSANNWDGGVQVDDGHKAEEVLPKVKVDEPFKHAPVTIVPAKDAYEIVLNNSGATLPKRDPVDERVVAMVRSGKVGTPQSVPDIREKLVAIKFSKERIDEIISLADKGIIYDPALVGGYPEYKGTPHVDTDKDGMPDAWETKHGLNPNDPADASKDLNGDGYSNIEKYINGIDPSKKVDWADLKNNKDTLAAAK
jgi:hypothetical protein